MRKRFAILTAMSLVLALLVPVASASAWTATYVHSGESIQAAINKAPSGGLISVERGTYKGNLDITRSVRLVGHGAVIVPAATPVPNACLPLLGGDVPGICVHGVFNSDGSMKSTISNVSLEGLTVRNFSGFGILAAGVKGFRAVRNVAAHNDEPGIFVGAVSNVALLYNRTYGNGSDGIVVSQSPSANAVIVGNSSYGNLGTGIGLGDSKGGRIALNDLHGNCVGIAVFATGAPGQTGAGNVSVELNQVTANNRLCPDQSAHGGPPAVGGIGIALIGTQNTVVALNDVRGNVAQAGAGITGGGIVLLDGKMFGAAAPTGNSIRLNWLSGNTPNDIYGDGTGTGNTVSGNMCTITNLVGAC
jgi:hypothetical protein